MTHLRRALRCLAGLGLLLAGFAAPPPRAQAATLDTTADHVFGQAGSFITRNINHGGLSASSLHDPAGLALDGLGNLYVADEYNNRVLEYNTPLTTNTGADRVFGQPSFITNTANNGGIRARSLSGPPGLALDPQGNLYIADYDNNRVLAYDAPLVSSAGANHVFGQSSFITNTNNSGGISNHSLYTPSGAATDAQGNLYVADANNHRVLEYDAPLTSDHQADRVFGQPSFITNTSNSGGLGPQSLNGPSGLALDAAGNLYVADFGNNRVLEYDAPLTSDNTADRVFGQADFTHNGANQGGRGAKTLAGPFGVALDALGDLYVADFSNDRVLEYHVPLTSSMAASRVFGQGGSFTTGDLNKGGVSADSLFGPAGVALDPQGNLYIADYENNRVLEYDVPVALARIFLPLSMR